MEQIVGSHELRSHLLPHPPLEDRESNDPSADVGAGQMRRNIRGRQDCVLVLPATAPMASINPRLSRPIPTRKVPSGFEHVLPNLCRCSSVAQAALTTFTPRVPP